MTVEVIYHGSSHSHNMEALAKGNLRKSECAEKITKYRCFLYHIAVGEAVMGCILSYLPDGGIHDVATARFR